MSKLSIASVLLNLATPVEAVHVLHVCAQTTNGLLPQSWAKVGDKFQIVNNEYYENSVAILQTLAGLSPIALNRLGHSLDPIRALTNNLRFLEQVGMDPEDAHEKVVELIDLFTGLGSDPALDIKPDDTFTIVGRQTSEDIQAINAQFKAWRQANPECTGPSSTPEDKRAELNAIILSAEKDLTVRHDRTGEIFHVPSRYLACQSILINDEESHARFDRIDAEVAQNETIH